MDKQTERGAVRSGWFAALAAAGTCAGAVAQTDGTSVRYTTVALSGDPVPGIAGASFAGFSDPRPLANGGVLFWARAQSGGDIEPSSDEGIWEWDGREMFLRLREGDAVPWGNELSTLGSLPAPSVGANGSFSLHATVTATNFPNPGTPVDPRDSGIFLVSGQDDVSLVVQQAGTLPGLAPDQVVGRITAPVQHRNGRLLINPGIEQEEEGYGIWELDTQGGGLTPILLRGETVDDRTVEFIDAPMLSREGDSAMLRFTRSPDAFDLDPFSQAIVHVGQDGTIFPQYSTGEPAHFPDLATFVDFTRSPVVSNSFEAAFFTRITHPADELRTAVWRSSSFSGLVALEGERAPTTSRSNYGVIQDSVSGNGQGMFAFVAGLVETGTNSPQGQGLGVGVQQDDSEAQIVAKSGDRLEDQPGDVRIRAIGSPVVDEIGRVIFSAWLEGDDVGPESNRALLAIDEMGRLVTVVREGQMLDVSGDGSDVRRVERFEFVPRETWNGASQVGLGRTMALHLGFQSGDGLDSESSGVVLAVLPSPADLNGDGVLDAADFFDYLILFGAGDDQADFNGDGFLDQRDFNLFLEAFIRG